MSNLTQDPFCNNKCYLTIIANSCTIANVEGGMKVEHSPGVKGKTDLRVREVPSDLKAHLKSEAALMGKTLNEYVLQILMERPGRRAGEV